MEKNAQYWIDRIAEAEARPVRNSVGDGFMNKSMHMAALRRALAEALGSMSPDEVQQARKALHLTQAQMAAVMGLRGPAAISEWEAGTRNPDARSVRLIRAYLDGYRPADWPLT